MARTRIEGAAPTRLWSELHLVTRNRIVVSVVISQQQIPVKYVELRMPVIAAGLYKFTELELLSWPVDRDSYKYG